jgi:hypothetical protein
MKKYVLSLLLIFSIAAGYVVYVRAQESIARAQAYAGKVESGIDKTIQWVGDLCRALATKELLDKWGPCPTTKD